MAFKMKGFTPFTKTNSVFTKRTYAEAKANDPKLDEYIKNRKNYKAGSTEYEDLQAKINAAYGTKRSEKIKASQVKRHKDDPSRTGDQNNKKDNTKNTKKNNEYVPQTVSPRKEYDPASRNKYEYTPQSQKKTEKSPMTLIELEQTEEYQDSDPRQRDLMKERVGISNDSQKIMNDPSIDPKRKKLILKSLEKADIEIQNQMQK